MDTVPAAAVAHAANAPQHTRHQRPRGLVRLVEHRAQILAVFALAAIAGGGRGDGVV